MLSFRCFLLSSVIALAPTAAYAYTYTICMKHLVHVVDSGLGEDYEVSSSGYSAWVSRGTKVRVHKGGGLVGLRQDQHHHRLLHV